MAFQKYSNMEQSLFTRIVRLGVPTVDLDGQGRSRPGICNLYNWRYKTLGNLAHVENWPIYKNANAGFYYEYQLINVEDFNGVGESEPSPYFYQNLAEAEYVVAVFMYMRLLGYPAEKISILTTYNGQKHLIRDVINMRCTDNPLIGRPHKVTTVDKYQGQQNDYVLVSLVRTRAVGHLRDVRRLIVAMSRARLGLYVFARASLFQNCFELQPTFNQLAQRPYELHLAQGEVFPTDRLAEHKPQHPPIIMKDMPEMAKYVYQYYMETIKAMQKGMGQPKSWSKPGDVPTSAPEKPAAAHPSGDRDTDSEDEEENIQRQSQQKSETNTNVACEQESESKNNPFQIESKSKNVAISEDVSQNMEVSENIAQDIEDSAAKSKITDIIDEKLTIVEDSENNTQSSTENISHNDKIPFDKLNESEEVSQNMEVSETSAQIEPNSDDTLDKTKETEDE